MTQLDPQQDGAGAPGDVDAEVQRELAALGDKTVEQLMSEAAPPTPAEPASASAESASGASDAAAASDDEHPRIESAVRRGRISMIRGDDVFIELSGVEGKNQGVVPLKQFERPPRLGSIMDFVIERLDQAEGFWVCSREGAVTRATWEHLQRGAFVEARVVATNKGGLELEMVGGIRAFMPASQIDMHHVTNMEEYVGQKIQAMVQDIDRKSRKVVISRRSFLEHERKAKRAKVLAELEVGQTRDGTVSGIMEYGAFVDLGGVDGLVHISDLSYKHVNKVEEVVKSGQQVKVKILKLDKERERISLGLKQVEPDPWETLATRIHVGDQISGRVMRTADFGAFVEVEPGVEGLLPASELSWKRHARVQDLVKENDIVRVMVLQLDGAKRRVTLSLKQAVGDPWQGAATRWARNTVVEATVTSIADFGAFVEIESGVEGLVHISELSDKRVNTVGDVLKVGDKKSFRVLETDEANRRIRLSLKAAEKPLAEPTPAPAGAAPAKPVAARKTPPKPGKGGLGSSAALGIGLGQIKL